MNAEPADLGNITTDWQPATSGVYYNARVSVGEQAETPCRNLRGIDIQPTSANNWSSIRLNLTGSLVGTAQAYPATAGPELNLGGRISGRIEAHVGKIMAKGIGAEASLGGSLETPGRVQSLEIGSIPAGATFTLNGSLAERSFEGGNRNVSEGLHGTLNVSADLAGGNLYFFGHSTGNLQVSGDIVGVGRSTAQLTFQDMSGNIIVGGNIDGAVFVLEEFDGEICAANLSGSQPLPRNIRIAQFGPNATICGQNVCSSVIQSNPDGIAKNRSLSFSLPPSATGGSGVLSEIRVSLVKLQHPDPPNAPCCPPPDFSAFEAGTCNEPLQGAVGGCGRWLGKPGTFLEYQDNPALGTFRASRLQCTPFYHDWSSEGFMHVVGAEIMPSSEYQVEIWPSIGASCSARLRTARWGDVEAPFQEPLPASLSQPNVIDIVQLVNKFKSVTGAPSKTVTQLQPNLPELNADINVLDIVAVVDAVKEKAYAFSGPCPCPSAVTCGSTACASPDPCSGGMCVKTCFRGTNSGEPCVNNSHCPGSTCGFPKACVGGANDGDICIADADCATPGLCRKNVGFCRDRCGRCTP